MCLHDDQKKRDLLLKTVTKKSDVNEGLALCQFVFYLYLVCRCLFLYFYLFKLSVILFKLLSPYIFTTQKSITLIISGIIYIFINNF